MFESHSDGLAALSALFGWTYFVAWISSFYPQVLLNYRRKHVGGLSIDYAAMNVVGYSCYSIYNLAFLFNSEIQDEYQRRHNGHPNVVEGNDAAFAVHAAFLTAITLFQTFYYPRSTGQQLSTFNRVVLSTGVLVILWHAGKVSILEKEHPIDLIYVFGACKLIVTIPKCLSQAWENYSRGSTVGYSIYPVHLDILGSILSLLQLLLDAYRTGDWYAVIGNFTKLALGLLSLFFNAIFMIQHYLIYPDRRDRDLEGISSRSHTGAVKSGEQSPLLQSTTDIV